MNDVYDVAIIGTGIAGTCIAREFSKYKLKIVMIDKENDVANGTTMANSAIVHAGYDAKAGTKKGEFNVKGSEMYEELCTALGVSYKRIGSLVAAFDDEDLETIKRLYDNGLANGVKDMQILKAEEVKEMEPNLSENIIGALFAPSAAIISPYETAIALAENAMDNGVELMLNKEVLDIEHLDEGYSILFESGFVEAKYVINCAGLYTDKIHKMVSKPSFEITPKKGDYFILDKNTGNFVNHVIFQCPSKRGKGVLITPTVHGNLLVGPSGSFVEDKDDVSTTQEDLDFIHKSALRVSEKIPFNKTIRTFSGLRASTITNDFIIEEAAKGFIDIGGFDSPGLSAAPAVAQYVVESIVNNDHSIVKKDDFIETRRAYTYFEGLTPEEKEAIIQKDKRYGKIICRCEMITEGEIVDAIRRNAGATTVKGVKKRTRAGMGRCQGGFCAPRVVEILARELKKDMKEIVLDSKDSYILTSKTKEVR